MSSVKPAENVRQIFGGHFYRMLSPEREDFIISPGAVLKLLMTISLGTNDRLSDEIFWDLYIKSVDEKRLAEEAAKEGIFDMGFSLEIRERLEQELSGFIQRDVLLNFFKNDFMELCDVVTIKNFVVADGALKFKEDYKTFMGQYFNTALLNRNKPEELQSIDKKKFADPFSDKNLDLLGSVSLKLRLCAPFIMKDDGSLEAYGSFKYNELPNNNSLDFRSRTLEIPMECGSTVPLTMLIFLPNDFGTLLKQSIGRDYTDFNKISEKLERKCVKVKLPKIKIERTTELTNFLAETSYRGLREFFNEPIIFENMFEKAKETQLSFGKYWQHTSLEIAASKRQINVENAASPEPDVVFDATDKSFIFVIRSDKVLYAIGQYFKGN